MEKRENHISVIDSPMASGKTTWAINHINDLNEDQKVIFITPYLKECDRVITGCKKKHFIQPDPIKGSGRKSVHFLNLIREGKNIVSTHSLFSAIDDEIINAIRSEEYTLILDECFSVVDKYDLFYDSPKNADKDAFTKNDIDSLIATGYVKIEDDYRVVWKQEKTLTKYEQLKNLADRELLYLVNDSLLLWSFPVEVFRQGIFEKIFILTFQFRYQIQYYYYSFFDLKYKQYHIETINEEYTMVETENYDYEKEWIKSIKPLITICNTTSINRIGSVYFNVHGNSVKTALCKNWYLKNPLLHKKISDNAVNYLRNYSNKEKSEDVMWACFKEFEKSISIRGLSLKAFVPLNARATNDYGDRKTLAYLINRYINPFYDQFFKKRNKTVDQNGLALSELVQWIWRSRIRNGKPITIYIPSERMRTLLEKFLDGEEIVF